MTEFVVGESVFTDESLSEYECLRIFFEIADQRGHPSPSIVVDDHGLAITHPDYVDRMGVPHAKAGAWAFCRRPAAEALGFPTGTDWIRENVPHMMVEDEPYQSAPWFSDQLYIQKFGSAQPHLMMPMCIAGPPAWSRDGSHICVMEERVGHLPFMPGMAKYLVWEYDLGIGQRRLVAGFAPETHLDLAELSYSLDDSWIHVCASGRNLLLRVDDGLIVTLPVISSAVAWNRPSGPNKMMVLLPDKRTGSLIAYDYDISENQLHAEAEIRSPTGQQLTAREFSISADGLGLVTASVGSPGIEQIRRGGVHAAAVIDFETGSIEPALPVRYRTPGAERRHHSPRWCEDPTMYPRASTTVADRLLESAAKSQVAPISKEIQEDQQHRWLDPAAAIISAWATGVIPVERFAQDVTQIAISCAEIDATSTAAALAPLRALADRDPSARAVLRCIANSHRLGSPLDALPLFPSRANTAARPDHSAAEAAAEGPVTIAVDRMLAADDLPGIASAVQMLVHEACLAGQPSDTIWPWLEALTSAALSRRSYAFVAKVGLATMIWNGLQMPKSTMLPVSGLGLGSVPPENAILLVLNCFEACTHLPERMILGQDSNAIFDVEATRTWAQERLRQLPQRDYLTAIARHPRPAAKPVAVVDSAAAADHEPGNQTMSKAEVFLSYVREDSTEVDRIAESLRAHGVNVWLDRTHIIPGERWERAIRHAIREGAYFIACFSPSYASRSKSYMNEELRLAIQQLRLMPQARRWFIPILLAACDVPEMSIDAVETLQDLQHIDFSLDWDNAITQLLGAIAPNP